MARGKTVPLAMTNFPPPAISRQRKKTIAARRSAESARLQASGSVVLLAILHSLLSASLLCFHLAGYRCHISKGISLYNSVLALNSLQKVYGRFPRILGMGDRASRLATLPTKSLPDQPSPSSDTSALLLNQLTYEGFVDDFTG
ncbi:hypothetical protein BDR03DRAFT_1019708 [Suillus americanus]|nr:hypothetical protein BDR03DRAFT_1019708 [Suillus americanus]